MLAEANSRSKWNLELTGGAEPSALAQPYAAEQGAEGTDPGGRPAFREFSHLLSASSSSSSVWWGSLKVERIKSDHEHALIPVPAP